MLVVMIAATFPACGGCDEDEQLDREGRRLWGREQLAAEVEEKAKTPIDANAIGDRPDLANRVLSMRYEEAVARIGFIEYQGKAVFNLERNKHRIRVVEDTLIQHGLHGSFRILQKDEDGIVSRELIYNGGVMYTRAGPGKMRVQGLTESRHYESLDEVFQPLRVYTSYFGPRIGLQNQGGATVDGRAAVKYAMVLLEGSDLITVEGMRGAKRPKKLSGTLMVDAKTGVPLAAKMKARLEIPPPKADQSPGVLDLSLDFTIKTTEGAEIKPKEFVPTIKHRPVDLDPLAFLDGGTRTSTVIGGKKKSPAKPPAE